MSLTNCPECQHEISNMAAVCPNCGLEFKRPNTVASKPVVITETKRREEFPKWAIVMLAAVGVSVLFLVFAVMRNDDQNANNKNIDVDLTKTRQADRRDDVVGHNDQPNEISVPSGSTVVNPPVDSSVPSTQQNIPSTSGGGIQSAPSDRGTVKIEAKILSKNGEIQSVKKEKFYLLDEDLETILNDAKLKPIEGNSLSNSFGLAVMYPDRYRDFNRHALAAIQIHIKYDVLTDSGGKALITEVKPDSYYLFGITKSKTGFAIWNSPVSINIGENLLNLSPASLTEMSE